MEAAHALVEAAPALEIEPATMHAEYAREPGRFVDQGAMLGLSNPASGPLRLRRGEREGEVIGEATLGPLHGGAPGLVHGGILATLMDEVLGHTAISMGFRVVTARLEIRYRAPTPLGVPLLCRGEIVSHRGRRFETRGEIVVEGTQTVTAKGLFVDIEGRAF